MRDIEWDQKREIGGREKQGQKKEESKWDDEPLSYATVTFQV